MCFWFKILNGDCGFSFFYVFLDLCIYLFWCAYVSTLSLPFSFVLFRFNLLGKTLDSCAEHGCLWQSLLVWTGMNVAFVSVAGILVTCVEVNEYSA